MVEFLFKVFIFAPPLLLAVMLHEIAHGYVAKRLGDPTATVQGRLSLNPIRHIDPMMTIILPGLLILAGSPVIFGGAKPVPVNPRYFQNPRQGMAMVALAGPATNFVLAFICWLLMKPLIELPAGGLVAYVVAAWLAYGVLINLVLAIFNLLPVPPLDGGRIAVGLLPRPAAIALARLEPYGLFIVFALLYFGVVGSVLSPLVDFALRSLERLA